MARAALLADGSAAPGLWGIVITMLLGFVAVYALLPRPHSYPRIWGAASAGLALLLGGILLTNAGSFSAESLLFYLFSFTSVVSGGLLVTLNNPVRGALSFALVVLSTCGLFLLQAAPFLMAATAIVYAGAIIVTFIFVIMLAQQAGMSDADHRSREPFLACLTGFVLLGTILYVLLSGSDSQLPLEGTGAGSRFLPADNVAGLGGLLFTDYLLPVELGGTLLLVATIGAIAIATRRREEKR
jgi:NADH-quinone oxidoreductase subunit J